jgi:3D (Asp-Asp-Asp) domain-containing protein
MYSLPITSYSDYWRTARVWGSYLSGIAVLAAGTYYSPLSNPDISKIQQPQQRSPQLFNTKSLNDEVSFLESRHKALTFNNELAGEVSRGTGESSMKAPEKTILGSGKMLEKTEFIDKEIPFETKYIESDKLPPGMSQVQEDGEKGILRQVAKTFEIEGQPVDQKIQASYQLKRPKKKVIIQNSKPIKGEQFDLSTLKISQSLKVESTAYTYTGARTASGMIPRQGLIAVDPKVIAMGSKVYVEGYGYAIAADTGGDIQGNRIDVFFPDLRKCVDWGRRNVSVYIMNNK